MHHSLASIRQSLARVRSVVRALYVVDGAMRFVLFALGLAVASFVLDRFLEFPRALRAILLLAEVGALGAMFWRWVVYPARFPIEIEDVAAQVERTNPFLKDRLISALQLERLVAQPDYADSIPLSKAVIREAEELAGGIQFMRIVRPKPVVLVGLAALVALGATGGVAVNFPRLATYWAMRDLALADLEWPRDDEVHLVRRRFKASAEQPVVVRFLLDRPELLTGAELRVLERVDTPPAGALVRAVRTIDAEVARHEAIAQVEPEGAISYRETAVPLSFEDSANGPVAVATLVPSARQRYFFVRTTETHRAAMLSLDEERVLSPLYEVEPIAGRVDSPGSGGAAQPALEVPVPDRQIYVPRGHTLKLEAMVFGALGAATIHYRFPSDEAEREDVMSSIDRDNRCVYEDFNEIREPIEFRLASGDRGPTGEPYRVQVRMPPAVVGHVIDLAYPSYLGIVADPALATGRDFLSTPLGTKFAIRVTGEFTAPRTERDEPAVKEPYAAWLRFDNESLGEIALVQDGPAVPKEGAAGQVTVAFRGELVATRDTSFYFALRGSNRLTNENPAYFQVTVTDDRPPTIEIDRPASSRYTATREATIRTVVRAADDNGLGRVVLRYRVEGAATYDELELKAAAAPFKHDYGPGEAPTNEPKDQRFEFAWSLEKIAGLAVGKRLLYHVVGEDYAAYSRDADGRLVVRTRGQATYRYGSGYAEREEKADRPDMAIEIVTKLQIEREISDRLQMLRDTAIKLHRGQVEIQKVTLGYAGNEKYSSEDLDAMFRLELQQNDLVRATQDGIRQPLIEIQELYRENSLTPASNVGEMIRLASLIHLDLGPQAAKLLKDPQSIGDPAAQRAALTAAAEVQGKVAVALEAIVTELARWVDMAEVIRDAQDLLDLQKKINEETKTLRDQHR